MKKYAVLFRSLLTGLIGGIAMSTMTLIVHYFKMVEISPKDYILLFLSAEKWLSKWYGTLFTVFLYGVISMGITLVYYLFLKRFKRQIVGILFGLSLLVAIFILLPKLLSIFPYLFAMSTRSIVMMTCLFIVYGLFVGYSISFDFNGLELDKEDK